MAEDPRLIVSEVDYYYYNSKNTVRIVVYETASRDVVVPSTM